MAQLLVFFATSKCSPHVIKWFLNRHLNRSMLMFCMCQKKNSLWNTWKRKKKKNIKNKYDSSWASASVPPNKNKKKAHKKIICTFISQEREKSWKLQNMNKNPQTDKSGEGRDTTTWNRFEWFLLAAATLDVGKLLAQQQIQHFNLLGVARIYNPQVWSSPTSSVVQAEVLKCALSVLHFDIVNWDSHNQIAFKHRVSEDRRQSWDVSIRRRSFYFKAGQRRSSSQRMVSSHRPGTSRGK